MPMHMLLLFKNAHLQTLDLRKSKNNNKEQTKKHTQKKKTTTKKKKNNKNMQILHKAHGFFLSVRQNILDQSFWRTFEFYFQYCYPLACCIPLHWNIWTSTCELRHLSDCWATKALVSLHMCRLTRAFTARIHKVWMKMKTQAKF